MKSTTCFFDDDRKEKDGTFLYRLLKDKVTCYLLIFKFISNRIQKRAEAAVDAEYPSYGVTGPNASGSKMSPSSTMSDRKLAQSAQMFHYQQQRQQMMAQEKYSHSVSNQV
jgi:hypothetical protein